MNILIITTSLYEGGAERVVTRLASALCEKHSVHVVCTWPEGNDRGTYPVDPRVNVIPLRLPNPFHRCVTSKALWYAVRLIQRKQRLKRIKKALKIDVSISFLTQCNTDNVLSARGEKTVISVRNIMRTPVPKYWLWRLMDAVHCAYAGRKADRVVAVSENVGLEQHRAFGVKKEKIRTIYNPADAPALLAASEKPTGNPEFDAFRASHDILFITAGRLEEQKGQHHLIRAFRRTCEQFPSAGLVFLGQGSLLEDLRKTVSANHLKDHVFFAGFQPVPFPYLGKADIFVMSSLYEGFSNAMLEAMACGLPLLLTDCNSGPRELLAPDTDSRRRTRKIERAPYGILTPVCSGHKNLLDGPLEKEEALLSDAMCLLAGDGRLRSYYAEQDRKRIADFSTERILSDWESLLLELCGRS